MGCCGSKSDATDGPPPRGNFKKAGQGHRLGDAAEPAAQSPTATRSQAGGGASTLKIPPPEPPKQVKPTVAPPPVEMDEMRAKAAAAAEIRLKQSEMRGVQGTKPKVKKIEERADSGKRDELVSGWQS